MQGQPQLVGQPPVEAGEGGVDGQLEVDQAVPGLELGLPDLTGRQPHGVLSREHQESHQQNNNGVERQALPLAGQGRQEHEERLQRTYFNVNR